MIGMPATVIGMTGTTLLALSLAGTSLDDMSRRVQMKVNMTTSAKADRLRQPVVPGSLATVSTVELVGISQAAVVLRDRNGEILYKTDPLTNTTLVMKDAELPVVTLKEVTRSVIRQNLDLPQRGSGQQPAGQKERRAKPIGCDGVVSSLANREVSQVPVLCLASLRVDG